NLKKNVLFAVGHLAMTNGTLSREEAELIRAIADVLGCPLPPFLADAILSPNTFPLEKPTPQKS
ncbi:MAG: hypothetical protein SNJ84_10775, partial [Verrucomicrobiia bacterium]